MKIIKIQRVMGSEETIKVLFEHNGQQAEFVYTLIGREIGIDYCNYEEKDNEDIYSIIHEWVEEHIRTETKVLYNNEEINFDGIVLKKDNLRDKILETLKGLEKDEGLSKEEIFNQIEFNHYTEQEFFNELLNLLEKAYIYEIKPNKFRILD